MKIADSEQFTQWLDARTKGLVQQFAAHTSRRGFLGRLGAAIVGVGALPLLPVSRAVAAESYSEVGDPQSCEYWRYCALGGTLCSCCGGSMNSCPPGAEPSPITWIGTCANPADGKHYLISYNDCCGKAMCNRCYCHNTERDKPVYFPSKSNDVLWCFGTKSHSYHCTVGIVMGEAGSA